MTWLPLARCGAVGVLLSLALMGCDPGGNSEFDEQKEPQFLKGRNQEMAMDFKGAIDSFEKDLELDPKNSSAHFELGLLYEREDIDDPAASIYHFNRFLKLRPASDRAEVVRSHINASKLKLASTASSICVSNQAVDRELERLMQDNKELRNRVERWQAYYQTSRESPPAAPALNAFPVAAARENLPRQVQSGPAPAVSRGLAIAPASNQGAATHTVKSGEYPAMIAAQHHVSLAALQRANPKMSSTHLRVGQILVIPAH